MKRRILIIWISLFITVLYTVSPFAKRYVRRYTPKRRVRYSGRRSTGGGKSILLKQVWSKGFLKGFKMSATFNRTDIRGVLRLFYEQTKLNFIITQNVGGTVTGRFRNVPALKALITILRANNLYFIEEGSIIRVVRPAEYKADIIKKNKITKVYDMNHANVGILKGALSPVLTKGVGKVVIDEKTNKIIITDLKGNFKQIERLISEVSKPGKQVYIDIKVVSIELKKGYEHGINWSQFKFANYFSFGTIFSSPEKYGGLTVSKATLGGEGYSGSLTLRLLNSLKNVKVLTSPKIVAAHGEKAKIHIGDSIPYISSISQSTTTPITTQSTVAFIDAGIKVNVTPFVGKDNKIRLKFEVEISSAVTEKITDTQTAPRKTKTEAHSMILCDNNALVVIGGLFEHAKSVQEEKLPILGYIPILKYLFSWKKEEITKREIAIMIRPSIMGSKRTVLKKEVRDLLNKK